jgi:hypothetical protein
VQHREDKKSQQNNTAITAECFRTKQKGLKKVGHDVIVIGLISTTTDVRTPDKNNNQQNQHRHCEQYH